MKVGKKRERRQRISAWMLAFVMVLSLVMVPAGKVEAAADPAQIGSSSEQVTAAITESNIDGDYHEYYLQVKNGLSESVSDWIVAIPLTGITGVQNWASEGWAKVQAYYTSDYLYIVPVSGGVVSSNATFGSATEGAYKFNYKGSSNINPDSVVVYYKTGSSSTGAFDEVIDNANVDSGSGSGGGGGTGGAQTDTTTDLNLDIEYNFAKLLQQSLYFYDANMCGEIEDICAISWRGNCHLDDKTVTYDGKTYDVSGGFHDAGDHVKFGLPQGYSSSVLAMAYYEFGEAFDELGQTEHYQIIMDHFCDYYTKSTIYDGSAVKAFCYQVGDGNADHGYWGPPENQTGSRPAWFADASNPATDEVSVAITTLAIHAMNFKDSEKSAEYLKTAKDLFAFVKNNSKTVATAGASGFYDSSDWKDDYASAAIALYKATNDESYLNEFKQQYTSGNIKTGWVLTWDNMWAVASMLNEDWNTVSQFASYSGNVINGYKIVDGWGSARYNTTLQFLGLSYDQANNKFSTADGDYCAWATGQMKYLLGNNAQKRCFVVGYNENSSKYPHHRAASRSGDAGSTRDDHYTLLGALVGGPDGSGNYKDDQGDYNCNEVALDYNAGMVGAAAGLYLLHKSDSDFPVELTPDSELAAIGITQYYGTSSVAVESITLDKEALTLQVGTEKTLSATVTPGGASRVYWKSSNTGVATVKNGVVTGVSEGEATITATAGGKSASCQIKVTTQAVDDNPEEGGNGEVKATGLTITANVKNASGVPVKSTYKLAAKKSMQLKVSFSPENAQKEELTYTSSNPKIATVSASGKVTAKKKAGTTTITVTSASGLKKSFKVKVMKKAVKKVTIKAKKAVSLKKGKTLQLKASVSPKGTSKTVFWKTSKKKIATVSQSGKVKALKKGTVKITAVATDGSGKKATLKIKIK